MKRLLFLAIALLTVDSPSHRATSLPLKSIWTPRLSRARTKPVLAGVLVQPHFLESELIRMGKGEHDLSEMYNVRMVYPAKAINYVRYHGKTQFGQGSLAHDVINTVDDLWFGSGISLCWS